MESAELNKKRIKRCYKRHELYHRFIHSEEYAYSPSSKYQLSCKENYLITGDIGYYKNIDDYWYLISNRMVAIIDRINKRILINSTYQWYIYELKSAIPDDYKIYYTIETISDKDVLSSEEQCLKLHSGYLLNQLTEHLSLFYLALENKLQTLYYDINNIFEWSSVKNIVDFIKNNKLKKYSFYNQSIIDKQTINCRNHTIKVIPPTLKQVATNTIFSKKDRIKLEQKYFYTKYCYGHGISFKDVITYWNKTDWSRNLANKYNRTNVCIDLLDNSEITWNDWVKKTTIAINKWFENEEEKRIKKSNENREKALKLLKDSVNHSECIINWREGKRFDVGTMSVSYRHYKRSKHRNKLGTWINEKLFNYFKFDNIQLRKIERNNNISIETSNHAIVPLPEAIKCWKLFLRLKSQFEITNKTCDAVYRLEDKNIKVGIYNLRSIKYCDKITDSKIPLNRKDWVIVIGCHHIWLEEIIDFIKYYHLEKEFEI